MNTTRKQRTRHKQIAAAEDALEFLPEEADEPAPEVQPAEIAAMHRSRGSRATGNIATGDEGTDDAGRPAFWFDDEEPEGDGAPTSADDETPDVEDLLVGQHYAFDDGSA